ncbi:MAG: helix-turn-helix transcriptional regulator [Flavobacterium sp.]|nr:helix-turn-helix transcriptional regulator [Flavobacterium sp.]
MKNILKSARESKGLTTRELSIMAGIDPALINKFENGKRIPTEIQIENLSTILEIELSKLKIARYKELLNANFDFDTHLIQAISEILSEKGINLTNDVIKETKLANILDEIEVLKNKLSNL